MPYLYPIVHAKFDESDAYKIREIISSLYEQSIASCTQEIAYLGTRRYPTKAMVKALRAIVSGMEDAHLMWPKANDEGAELDELDKMLAMDENAVPKTIELTMEFDALEVLISILKEYEEANFEDRSPLEP